MSVILDINKIKKNIKFLNKLINVDKIFHISCIIFKQEEDKVKFIFLHKRMIQIDQNFNLNVISAALIKQLKLELRFLNEMNF